jgi:hypothetical protein
VGIAGSIGFKGTHGTRGDDPALVYLTCEKLGQKLAANPNICVVTGGAYNRGENARLYGRGAPFKVAEAFQEERERKVVESLNAARTKPFVEWNASEVAAWFTALRDCDVNFRENHLHFLRCCAASIVGGNIEGKLLLDPTTPSALAKLLKVEEINSPGGHGGTFRLPAARSTDMRASEAQQGHTDPFENADMLRILKRIQGFREQQQQAE